MFKLTVIHVLEPRPFLAVCIVQLGIFTGGGMTLGMGVGAVSVTLINAEAVMGRRSGIDHLVALLADVLLSCSLDVSGGVEVAHGVSLTGGGGEAREERRNWRNPL